MNVTEAVTSRRSVRAFQDKPVDHAVLRHVLETAQRSPSGGNTQPWNAVMLTGAPLAELFAKVAEVLPQGRAAFSPESQGLRSHLRTVRRHLQPPPTSTR